MRTLISVIIIISDCKIKVKNDETLDKTLNRTFNKIHKINIHNKNKFSDEIAAD